jgi:hypothetical protein
MHPAWYLVSWFLNLLLIAVLVGIANKVLKMRIEEHHVLGAFFIFFLPVFLELVSFLAMGKPFFFSLAS